MLSTFRPALTRSVPVVAAFAVGALATIGLTHHSSSAIAQDGMQEMPPGMQEMMAAWTEARTPNEHHAGMAAFVGTWDVSTKMWMEPGGPPMDGEASATFEWMMEGRYIRQDFRGNFMGEAFHGIGISGYDNMRGQYVDLWIDDMSTSMSVMRGGGAADDSTRVMYGRMDDPMSGKVGMLVRSTIENHSADHFTFTMEDVSGSEPVTSMVMEYRRRK
ncbi:MAG: DUF1579 domain-containing protein [Phycisphaerales bacterium]